MRIKDLFEDKTRVKALSRKQSLGEDFIYYDFSKTHIDEKLIDSYVKKMDFDEKINGMFNGEKINFTEDRKVLHVGLRDKDVLDMICGGADVELDCDRRMVFDELIVIKEFVDDFEKGKVCGVTGKRLDTIVNIGIGGSDLGPRMVCDALSRYCRGVSTYFISNIDATDTIKVFEKIDVEKTLFVVVSKTFTTLETIKNAELVMRMMEERIGKDKFEITNKHFVAISSNVEEVKKYNISRVFAMWDFVGGRYSLWSAVGLSIALYIGFDNFVELLRGASDVDEEFRMRRGKDNTEILHALVEIFYSERGYNNKCLVSYDQYMEKFYLYLQQAEMESNGKYSRDGDTGMIIWGGVGTNSQHSFFQLLHQGTRKILSEFLLPLRPLHREKEHHEMVVSNCLAQSRALMIGKESDKQEEVFSGDRPTITICYSKLNPRVLGGLIAHYEHKIFIQGLYWRINSFDQFGVTLGKKIASELLDTLKSGKNDGYDESTNEMLVLLNDMRNIR